MMIGESRKTMIKRFTIECEINEQWINVFCSMLKRMELDGNVGHSEVVGIYSDGDGNFRPKFNINTSYRIVKPRHEDNLKSIYDAD